MDIITDYEWDLFVNDNIVSKDIIEVIALRIINRHNLTKRELAIYESDYNDDIEGIICKIVYGD